MIIVVFILLVIGAFIIKSQGGLNFDSKEDRKEFATEYKHWGERLWDNTKKVTGDLVSLDWIPDKPVDYEGTKFTQNDTKIN